MSLPEGLFIIQKSHHIEMVGKIMAKIIIAKITVILKMMELKVVEPILPRKQMLTIV